MNSQAFHDALEEAFSRLLKSMEYGQLEIADHINDVLHEHDPDDIFQSISPALLPCVGKLAKDLPNHFQNVKYVSQ